MKTTFRLKAVLFLVVACMFTSAAMAQTTKPIASPRDSVSGVVNGATITINYGSPSVKGRKIWGGLVPYNAVWRTGANEATRFTTTKDITVEGKTLPAGTYDFFAIPGEKTWTIIFNSVANQWGAFKYDASKDVLRVTVKPKASVMHERLVYKINGDGFELMWDELKVPVKTK
ncbi:DUF2911 domain-containing protein [Mucilaginibacter sp. E4BP6]|uniref:DUF2911 domain-containing protein n=1 Tax=Mucilaginibacter sp. E4BP6 TaxID=2723089 RepID=UPI0015C86548|nr:DUF2911 domain-containing protein [Mucilaginibacter sp. E4BP6]NYE67311.1 hypothetical protein [Mucilaginibacter sp. E4BP6]